MINEVIIIMMKKKEIPFYYFKYLYRKNVTNYLDYVSFKEQLKLVEHRSVQNPEYVALINNKLYFALFSEKTSLKMPKLLSYNFGPVFFYDGQIQHISDKNRLIAFFNQLLELHNKDGVFFRPISSCGGKGCFKITKENIANDLRDSYENLVKGNFVHTEVIGQHKKINEIHGKSINTIRIVTLVTSGGEIVVVSALMRFGVGDSVVDNGTYGGFFVGANMDNGTLKAKGHFLAEYGGGEIFVHPDSKFKFKGFQIPYFQEACKSVTDAAKVIPNRLIGWDVAITPNGPIIIETNAWPHIPMSDIAYGGLLKNKHIKNLLLELKK